MNEPLIIMQPDQLRELIMECVKSCLPGTEPQKPEKEILTVKEAAELLNISPDSVYTLTSKRLIPHSKVGKRLFFSRSDIIDYVRKNRRTTVQEVKDEAHRDMIAARGKG